MRTIILSLAALGLAGIGAALADQTQGSAPPVPFSEAFLADEHNVDTGRAIWQEQCQHCHGAKAYPGKAPKLRPARYKPDFVYRRVTDGFRKMPAWKDVYTDEERMQVVSYVLSPHFSP
jgi:mono/diheme cytochrome c family protein